MRTTFRALLVGWFVSSGCTEVRQPPQRPLNLIVISIDTLRADRLGVYGSPRATSPAIDAFAAQAVVFRQAVAESSWTLPSHFTLFSGLYPRTHGIQESNDLPSDEVRLLAELLEEQGYFTFALTDGGWLSPERGFARGFKSFQTAPQKRPPGLGPAVRHARRTLERRGPDEPFFLFLHTYDVHCPYAPPEPYRSMFATPESAAIEVEGKCGTPHFNRLMQLEPEEALYLSEVYDGGVRQADDTLAPFFRFLEEEGFLENTVVVLTSDHGEEFFEHGKIGHDRTLYRESLMIPLIVRAPGFVARTVAAPVGLVDVVPTLGELLGLEPRADWEGRSLVSAMRGSVPDSAEGEVRFSEIVRGASLVSWMSAEAHLIQDRDTGELQLFDLATDPLEQTNLAATDPDRAQRMLAGLVRFQASLEAREKAVLEGGGLSEEKLEELRRLGYLGD